MHGNTNIKYDTQGLHGERLGSVTSRGSRKSWRRYLLPSFNLLFTLHDNEKLNLECYL